MSSEFQKKYARFAIEIMAAQPDSREAEMTADQHFDEAAEHVKSFGFLDDAACKVCFRAGSISLNSGDLARAEEHMKRARIISNSVYAPDSRDYALVTIGLTETLIEAGEYEDAATVVEPFLESIDSEEITPDLLDVVVQGLVLIGQLYTQTSEYEAAEAACAEATSALRDGPVDYMPLLAKSLHQYAILSTRLGQFTKARNQHLESLELRRKLYGEHSVQFAVALGSLADVDTSIGQYELAVENYSLALKVFREQLGDLHPRVAIVDVSLGHASTMLGRFDLAKSSLLEAIQIYRFTAPKHPHLAQALNNLGFMYCTQGNFVESRTALEEAMELYESIEYYEPMEFAQCSNNLASVCKAKGDFMRAESLYRASLKRLTEKFGTKHPNVATCFNNLGNLLRLLGRLEESESALLEGLASLDEDDVNPIYARLAHNLAETYRLTGRSELAEPFARNAVRCLSAQLGRQHPNTLRALAALSAILIELEKLNEAEQHLSHIISSLDRSEASHSFDIANSLALLGRLYAIRGQLGLAKQNLELSVDICDGIASDPTGVFGQLRQGCHGLLVELGSNINR